MEELMSEITEELTIELGLTEESDIRILTIKVKNAVKEICNAFNFKEWHDDAFIVSELDKHAHNIKMLATYDYNKIGAEGEQSHSENGISRGYESRGKCFAGIVPFAD